MLKLLQESSSLNRCGLENLWRDIALIQRKRYNEEVILCTIPLRTELNSVNEASLLSFVTVKSRTEPLGYFGLSFLR